MMQKQSCILIQQYLYFIDKWFDNLHTSKIWGLSQKKMYIVFFARYQLYNVSTDEK